MNKRKATMATPTAQSAFDELIKKMFLILPPEKFARDLRRFLRLKESDQQIIAEAFLSRTLALDEKLPQMPNVDAQLVFERILLDLRANGYGHDSGLMLDILKEIGLDGDAEEDRLLCFLGALLDSWEAEIRYTL